MHDSKGRKIEFGDVVLAKSWAHDGKHRAMKVVGGTSGADTCNLQCLDFDMPTAFTLTAKETTVLVTRDGEFVGAPEVTK